MATRARPHLCLFGMAVPGYDRQLLQVESRRLQFFRDPPRLRMRVVNGDNSIRSWGDAHAWSLFRIGALTREVQHGMTITSRPVAY